MWPWGAVAAVALLAIALIEGIAWLWSIVKPSNFLEGRMTHPLLHVASPEKRARRATIKIFGKRWVKRHYGVSVTTVPAPRCHARAFHRVDAAFRAIVGVLQAHPQPGALRIAAMAQLTPYRSRGKGKGARR